MLGHSLDNDMHALKIVHHRVIDTAILYPHPAGPPMKSALRFLANRYLKKSIQVLFPHPVRWIACLLSAARWGGVGDTTRHGTPRVPHPFEVCGGGVSNCSSTGAARFAPAMSCFLWMLFGGNASQRVRGALGRALGMTLSTLEPPLQLQYQGSPGIREGLGSPGTLIRRRKPGTLRCEVDIGQSLSLGLQGPWALIPATCEQGR